MKIPSSLFALNRQQVDAKLQEYKQLLESDAVDQHAASSAKLKADATRKALLQKEAELREIIDFVSESAVESAEYRRQLMRHCGLRDK